MHQQVPLEDRKRMAEKFGLNHWSDHPTSVEYVLMARILQLEDQILAMGSRSQSMVNSQLSSIHVQSTVSMDEFVPEEQS